MPRSAFRAWLAFAAMGAIILMGACQRQPEANVAQNAPAEEVSLPRLPVAESPLDRAALLQAVAKAASGAALGESAAEAQRELDGDRFELRIRFGCPAAAPTGEDDAFDVRFDAATRTLRLRAAPDLRLDEAWIAALAGDTVEAVEGFWLRRPWLLTAGCPPVASRSPASPLPRSNRAERPKPASAAAEEQPPAPVRSHRIGIAQFFTQTDARTGRRGERAYEATKVLAADEQPSSQGYELVLSGRLARLPDGRVIPCRVHTVDLPPDCIVSVDIDRVRVERPDTRAVVAEWSA